MKSAAQNPTDSRAVSHAGALPLFDSDVAPHILLAQIEARGAEPHPSPAQQAGHRHWSEGVALLRQRAWGDASRAFGRATRAAPHDGLYWINLAHAQRHAGQLQRSVAAARRALRVEPDNPIALRLLGEGLRQLHRYAEAADTFARLESVGHADAQSMLQHATMLQALQRPAESVPLLFRALALDPGLTGAHALLAAALRDQGLKREAVECLKTVLALSPDNVEARSHLSYEKRHVCDWSDLAEDVHALSQSLAAAPQGLARSVATFGLLSLPIDPELQLAAARGESLALALGVQPLPAVVPAGRLGAGRSRIRLGCLSYDFREHPVSQLLVEMFEALDPECFELVLYSAGPDDSSSLRQRVKAAATQFVDIRGISDEQAARRMRADGVDLMLDLMGHTRGHRLGILARRPAPVQAAYLGFPGSTGADFIDYLIGDPLVTPMELAHLYSEKLAQLPLSFLPNGGWRPLPQPMSRAEVGLPVDAFVMCAFNHTYKILPEAFDHWCAVLRDVPHAVLWLKQTNPQLHDNVRREACSRGVDPQRIVFARTMSYEAHFSRLALADVFVDTWPYNAHTTAADALWAGVPVVTVYGNGFASRVAASALNAVGLGELAFATPEAYRCAILALALEPQLLQAYRRHLNEQRLTLPLFDSASYGAAFGALLQRMWQRWCDGLPAEHLPAL